MIRKYITIFSLFLFYPAWVFALPSVSSVSGALGHDNSITISGSDFGTKSPAAPRIWDACDADSTDTLSTHWPGGSWPESCPTPEETPYRVDYRSDFHGMGYPHSRITKYLCAATTRCNFGSGLIWTSGQSDNFFTTDTWGVNKLFAIYYYRLSSTFANETSISTDNLKEVSANGSPGGYLDGYDTYLDHVNSQTPPLMYPNYAGMSGYVLYPNPMGGWQHMELLWDDTGYFWSMSNGDTVASMSAWYGPSDKQINHADGNPPTTISIGGFARHPRSPTTGNYRYWAGLYLDDTYSRVMLGDNSSWDSCKIREPQIPSAWSTSSITVTVNQGALPDGIAYLFVFDSDNDANATGYEVTLGEDSGGTCIIW